MSETPKAERKPRKKAAPKPKKVKETPKERWDRMKAENHEAHAKKVAANAAIRAKHNIGQSDQIPEHLRERPEGAPNPEFKGGRRNRRAYGIRRNPKAGFRWRNGGGRMHLERFEQPWAVEADERAMAAAQGATGGIG